ncbi:MFS transporter [Aureivirga sp. CE67]|uniref:MFS transporter n=1 Tax=Aureivirga sp. CE67 TaxID=1788983 RepID=UPI0018CBE539|nr:MFS transporter [Aureivirga sp. CE67]
MKQHQEHSLFSLPVLIAMFGYLVDVYDIAIFGILRVESLQDLGLNAQEISVQGTWIINLQLIGMILGGFVFGVLGDKWGRKNILFTSIFIYSTATLLNAFVHHIEMYMILRFLAGFGLAGELGAGITLMAETVKKKHRSYATSLITGIGLLGGSLAFLVYDYTTWRTALFIGGVLGFLLLFARARFLDSHLFEKTKNTLEETHLGSLKLLFFRKEIFHKYLFCLGVAVPIQFFYGMFIFLANEMTKALGFEQPVEVGVCVLWYFVGNAIGDLFSGPLSFYLKSRKKVIRLLTTGLFILMILTLSDVFSTTTLYYALSLISGIIAGFWALFLITTSENFGTNLRATATVSAPNIVRGILIFFFIAYQSLKPTFGVIHTVIILSVICLIISVISNWKLKESFGKDLDYTET